MANHDIIVVGASAGGVEALVRLVKGLPENLAAAVFVVLHISPQGPSMLPAILSRSGPLPAIHARDDMKIEDGHVYIAPPDYHLMLESGYMHVIRGPKENRHRPAIDPLFRSAALVYGPRCVGVVLSGTLDDGTAGLLALKQRGGIAVVQDLQEATYVDMPRSALRHVQVDYCLPVSEIASLLVRLAREPAEDDKAYPISDRLLKEVRVTKMDKDEMENGQHAGTPSAFSCPECGGVLWEIKDSELVRYRCRVGHAYSPDSIQAAQAEALEDALWAALRSLNENANLSHRMANHARERGQTWLKHRFDEKEREAKMRAAVILEALGEHETEDVTGEDDVEDGIQDAEVS